MSWLQFAGRAPRHSCPEKNVGKIHLSNNLDLYFLIFGVNYKVAIDPFAGGVAGLI